MDANKLDECSECGAMVDRMAKHRQWHDALNAVAPGLQAELQRLKDANPPAKVWVHRR
jgi:hypothetical protein